MAQAVRICLALLPFASASCILGSRDECGGNGVCVSDSFFDNDPFFNQCECDFCWSGAGSCDQNICIFLMIPVVFVVCICCAFCICCCCIGGTMRTMWKTQPQAVPPVVVGPAAYVDPTPPSMVVVEAKVVEPAAPVVVGATAVNETNAA